MNKRTKIHAASLTTPRMKRAVAALRRFSAGLTTRAWIREAHICAVNSVAAELRAAGIPVTCERKGGNFWYRLEAK